ncbi:MAG TPA: ThiF family adenylyltransferase, partial [Isosphaeraceae bacterium]|nr:ThiF family adenylyltransferase [Isosphaeraceae bacterium]
MSPGDGKPLWPPLQPPAAAPMPIDEPPPHEPRNAPVPAAPAEAIDDRTLWIDDSDRYSRLRLISWWRQEVIQSARVLVVGAGALGNEVLKNLALLGLGSITVIDLDEVEPSNLSRSVLFRDGDAGRPKAEVAAQRAQEINPTIRVRPIQGDVITDLGLGHFADQNLVIGCLDNREARLWVNRQCWKVGTPWVDAGIQEIQGVVKVFVPPHSACYECAMTERDYQLLNLRYSCPLLARDEILAGKVPTAPTIASMMAALQVQEALKLLHGIPAAAGCALVFNGVTNQFYTTQLPFRDDCLSHETYPPAQPLNLGHANSVGELFAAAGESLEGPLTLALD